MVMKIDDHRWENPTNHGALNYIYIHIIWYIYYIYIHNMIYIYSLMMIWWIDGIHGVLMFRMRLGDLKRLAFPDCILNEPPVNKHGNGNPFFPEVNYSYTHIYIIYTYIRTYVHTNIHTNIHTYIEKIKVVDSNCHVCDVYQRLCYLLTPAHVCFGLYGVST